MEEWVKICESIIPNDYYLIQTRFNLQNQLTLYLITQSRQFKIKFDDFIAHDCLFEGWAYNDNYIEMGYAKNRPNLTDGVIYELKNGEFGDKLRESLSDDKLYSQFVIIGINYIVNVMARGITISELKKEEYF